jgi:cellulose synthase (UDP-forming)
MHTSTSTQRMCVSKEIVLGVVCIVMTMLSYAVVLRDQGALLQIHLSVKNQSGTTEIVVLSLIIFGFAYSIMVYHIARLAYFWRLRENGSDQRQFSSASLGALKEPCPPIVVLIPSYCEEVFVVWQTLMAAALIDYPDRHIVLLVDNPPKPDNTIERDALTAARAQPMLIQALFAVICGNVAVEAEILREASLETTVQMGRLSLGVANLYVKAADFLETVARRVDDGEFAGPDTHIRQFFVENVLLAPAQSHRDSARDVLENPGDLKNLREHIRRLSTMFRFEIDVFERKRFLNLPHAPNKASNLNAYLGLMGKKFNIRSNDGNIWLDPTESEAANFSVRAAEFVIVLDADSFMRADYARKTLAVLLAPGNERIAIAQTPYKAIPGSPSILERAAGVSTDVHFCVAQGMSILHSGFWVGATALVRVAALVDIAERETERGFEFPAFIPDRTVIEDMDATIRLAARGWRVRHLPEHLNWSATPADFGALVVQRRRWANGGLLILPLLLRYLTRRPLTFATFIEGVLRIYHLLAAPINVFGGLAILVYPFDVTFASTWLSLAIIPYLYLHGRDLKRLGYYWMDLFRIFALNIVLLPVAMAGILKSIHQGIRGHKVPFGRTPKIMHRTVPPTVFLIAPVALAVWSIHCFYQDVALDLRGQAFPSLVCSLALAYSILMFIGIKPLFDDLLSAIKRRLGIGQQASESGVFAAFGEGKKGFDESIGATRSPAE